MKKLLCKLLILGMVFWLGVGSAQAVTTDNFSITVTCSYLSINLRNYTDTADYSTWAIGTVAENTPSTMTEAQGILLDNNANASTNISAYVSSQGADWTVDSAAGADKYKLELKSFDATQGSPDLSSGTTVLNASNPGPTIKSGLAASTNQFIYCKFTTPTSTTSGNQQTITVTVVSATAG